jgi:hypothetical protein
MKLLYYSSTSTSGHRCEAGVRKGTDAKPDSGRRGHDKGARTAPCPRSEPVDALAPRPTTNHVPVVGWAVESLGFRCRAGAIVIFLF